MVRGHCLCLVMTNQFVPLSDSSYICAAKKKRNDTGVTMNTLICGTLFTIVMALTACTHKPSYPAEIENELKVLDRIVDDSSTYKDEKMRKISDMRSALRPDSTDEYRYGIYDGIYREYYQYDADSAMTYVKKKLAIAQRTDSYRIKTDAILDLAERYVLSGMYAESLHILDTLDTAGMDSTLMVEYFHVCQSLYEDLSSTTDDPELKVKYWNTKNRYRASRLEYLPQDDIARLFVLSEMSRESGTGENMLPAIKARIQSPDMDCHNKAMLCYIAARIYKANGDRENELLYYIRSACNDLMAPVNDYRSLHELAARLYVDGEIKRAYRYISRAIQDAMVAKSRLNITSINNILPIISASYDTLMQKKHRQLIYLLAGTCILAVLLVFAVSVIIEAHNRTIAAEKKTREKNELLKEANDSLQKYISMLQEADRIKESYLSRYMDMCVEYIESFERYRSQLRQTAKSGGFEKIMENLRSGNYIRKELQEFYSQFDSTFLTLFPDFVKEFNMLLKPECRIEDRSSEKILSTELRVMALIRLGVHDSAKISKFLRRSLSTVYNYRAKMRNAALSDRDDLEKQVMSIGRPSDLTTKNQA